MTQLKPLVSYIIPAFNEAAVLGRNLAELVDYVRTLEGDYRYEFVVVNAGSSDATGAIVSAFAADRLGFIVLHQLENRGVSAALLAGVAHARGDIIVTLDAGLSYAPYHIERMLRGMRRTNAAIVVASPYLRGGSVANVPFRHKLLAAWVNRYLCVATAGQLATVTCMVRAYDARALRKLMTQDVCNLDFNCETVFAALRLGMPVLEVPARWQPRTARIAPGGRAAGTNDAHSWSAMMAGLRFRPSMFFGIFGVLPGVLPLLALGRTLFHGSRTSTESSTQSRA